MSATHYENTSLISNDGEYSKSLPNTIHSRSVRGTDLPKCEIEEYNPSRRHLSRKSSILRSGSKSPVKNRKDSYGVVITHEDKQQKIRFKDAVKEVKVVDNWKDYNSLEERPCCICNMF